jgi:hypothetical protein
MLSRPKTRDVVASFIASTLSDVLSHGSTLCDDDQGAMVRVSSVKVRRNVVDIVVDVSDHSDRVDSYDFSIQVHNPLVVNDNGKWEVPGENDE